MTGTRIPLTGRERALAAIDDYDLRMDGIDTERRDSDAERFRGLLLRALAEHPDARWEVSDEARDARRGRRRNA